MRIGNARQSSADWGGLAPLVLPAGRRSSSLFWFPRTGGRDGTAVCRCAPGESARDRGGPRRCRL